MYFSIRLNVIKVLQFISLLFQFSLQKFQKYAIVKEGFFMAKTLKQLLNQKSFSGKDVGTLFLYSLKKDIEDAYKNRLPEPAVPQDFFDAAYKSILGNKEEYDTWLVYKHLEGKYFQQQKDFQTYRQQFYHFYTELELLFEEMERMDVVAKKLHDLQLPEDKFKSVADELLTTPSLFTEKFQTKRSMASDAIYFLKDTLIYFYCSNQAYKDLFAELDVSFMDSTLFNVSELEKDILAFNELFSRVTKKQDGPTTEKLLRFYEIIDDFSEFYPVQETTRFGISIDKLVDQANPDITIVDNIESTIDLMIRDVEEKNGLN